MVNYNLCISYFLDGAFSINLNLVLLLYVNVAHLNRFHILACNFLFVEPRYISMEPMIYDFLVHF